MSGSELETSLETRVRELERRLARGRAFAIGAVVLVVAACAAAAARNDVEEVRARRFVVVDEQGEVRGTFSSDPGLFDVGITMHANDGLASVLLGVRGARDPQDTNSGSPDPFALLSVESSADDATFSVVNVAANARHAHVGASTDSSSASLAASAEEALVVADHGDDSEHDQGDWGTPRVQIRARQTAARIEIVDVSGTTRTALE